MPFANQQQPIPVDLAAIWRGLVEGSEAIVDMFFSDIECGFVLAQRRQGSEEGNSGLVGRRLVVLESVLRGVSQNYLAIELELAASTVALNAKSGLEQLGVDTRPSRAHPLLMLVASVADGPQSRIPAFERALDRHARAITIPRPELCVSHMLPQAQHQAVALLVEGRSYAEIAQQRGTSPRTIANQLAASFRTLHVSGRGELIQRLFVLSGWLPDAAARAA